MSLAKFELFDRKTVSELDVINEFMISFVVIVLKRASFILDQSSKAMQIVDSSRCSDFRTITVTSNRCHRNLLFVHKPDNIVTYVL